VFLGQHPVDSSAMPRSMQKQSWNGIYYMLIIKKNGDSPLVAEAFARGSTTYCYDVDLVIAFR
jgi:hypothetical protein